ncbi:hypothetical protein LTR04_002040 [Oleoguttula sp. CCFEE 6159]|nr:hypothetical protein LTR04_002040 [Oleoguttula sp. CCFEE 6159]
MIVRSLVLRQGRRALAKPPARTWKRLLASQADSIEASLQNSLKETHSIEAVINSQALHPVQPIDDVSHATAETRSVAEDYSTFKRQQELTRHLGTSISPHYQPHTLVTNPPSPQDITLELLLASQAHLGHSTSLWNPANARYIFGIRQGVHIIDLSTIAAHLRRACKIVEGVTSRGGLVLFVGTRPGQDRCVVKAAELAQGCHLFERWIPGSITNGQQILRRCRMKVVDEFDRDVPGFELQLLDRAVLKPDLVVCLNPLENYVLLHECGLNNIPTIGVIDTDADPTWVTYPIPANDDRLVVSV